jgi:hypothetical protein
VAAAGAGTFGRLAAMPVAYGPSRSRFTADADHRPRTHDDPGFRPDSDDEHFDR